MFSIPIGRVLVAGVILGFLGLGLLPSAPNMKEAAITIETQTTTSVMNHSFVVDIMLTANEPINAFKGILHFDPNFLTIDSIDYNISLADLWAEEPWYSNGDGTLTFIGGTTRTGGFAGKERIVQVTFTGKSIGET